jgi:DNA-binding FadR family transcriptional regulator
VSEAIRPLYPALNPRRHGSTLAATVVAALEEDIVRLGWPVGTVIATEAELLDRFGVSSPVLRQAVSILESRQVARMRRGPGGGLVVVAPDETSVGTSVALYLEYLRIQPQVVSQARASIEIACVELAARQITEADVPKLRQLVGAEPSGLRDGDLDCLVDVHLAIADLSGNPVLALFLRMLMSLLISRAADGRDRRPTENPAHLHRLHQEHVGIVEALAAGDPALARLRMMRHLEHTRFDSPWWRVSAQVPDE